MDNKLKEDIEQIVTNIFSEKAQADQKQKTQDALNESAEVVETLTQTLDETKAALSTAQDSIKELSAEKDSEISNIKSELEAAQAKLEETKVALAASEESLINIKKDQLAEARMTELKEVKVTMESNLEAQSAKVREQSDEEFAAYKAERVELRDAVKKELEKAAAEATAAAAAAADAVAGTDATVVGKEVAAKIVTTPANIPVGQAMAAAMNFETNPSDDMVNKYAELGKTMAKNMKPGSDK